MDESLPRQPYHAVAEEGWPSALIEAVADAARTEVSQALDAVAGADMLGVVATERRIPSRLDEILRSHALLHAAEGQLFERAVIEAAEGAHWRVHVLEPGSVLVPPAVDALGRSIGPPWQKDHKWATTAALTALGST